MSSKLNHPVRPGGLSPSDHEAIIALSARGWGARRIAQSIEKHPSTVRWFMYSHGLVAPKYGLKPYVRNGRTVMPFSPEEDAYIEALRVQDFGLSMIAELSTRRFGHRRTGHAIHVRLVMLAAREVA